MKIKQTIRNLVAGSLLLAPLFAIAVPVGYAAGAECGGVQTSIISCPEDNSAKDAEGNPDITKTGIWSLLLVGINILTAGIGVVALGGLVYGSILYTSAGGNPEQVKKARTVFTNVVIGIVAYAGMWALLNFIIPGGVL